MVGTFIAIFILLIVLFLTSILVGAILGGKTLGEILRKGIVGSIFLAFGMAGYHYYRTSDTSETSYYDDSESPVMRGSMDEPEDLGITLSASQLIKIYLENEVNADRQLKDKIFNVEGIIGNIGKGFGGEAYVVLETDDPIQTVQCFLYKENMAYGLKRGQHVKLSGRCDGLLMNVLMKDCQLISE